MQFGWINWLVVAGFFVITALIGIYFTFRMKSVEDFSLAGRRMHWFPLALSIIATGVSAISLLGTPTYIFRHNLQFTAPRWLVSIPVILLVSFFVIPLYYRLKLYTIYEYLERRFHPFVRTAVSCIMLISRLGWIATAMYIPSLVLATITSMPIWCCVLIVGVVSTAYTVGGGMSVVIWTDTVQFFMMLVGVIACIVVILQMFNGDISEVWRQASAAGNTKMFDFSLDIKREAIFWAVVLQSVGATLSMYMTDQIIIQRTLSARSKAHAIGSMIGNALISVPFGMLLAFIGIGLAAYFHTHPQALASLTVSDPDPSKAMDKVMPFFIMNQLPIGIGGIFVASIFACTMSSVDSAVNSMATVFLKDILNRHFPSRRLNDEKYQLGLIRKLTLLFGFLATATALFVGNIGTIMKIWTLLASMIAAPLTGIFILGLFTKRANTFGIIVGSIASYVFSPIAFFYYEVNWVMIGTVNTFVTLVVGYAASLLAPRKFQKTNIEIEKE